MTDLTRPPDGLCRAGVLLAVVLGLRQLGGRSEGVAAAPGPVATIAVQDGASGGGDRVVVHVAGAVRDPGVYKLPSSARVDDAVTRAGGATRRADLGGLNLAAKLEDGRQVLVPERVRAGSPSGPASADPGAQAEGQPLNLNTASLEQLDTLSGIGPTTAQKILDFREERGGFGSIEELGEIPGIGDKRLASLREEVTL